MFNLFKKIKNIWLILCFIGFYTSVSSQIIENETLANNSAFVSESFRQIINLSEKINLFFNNHIDSEDIYKQLNSKFYKALKQINSENVYLIYNNDSNNDFFLVNFDSSKVYHFYKNSLFQIPEYVKEHENVNGLNIDLYDLNEELLKHIFKLRNLNILNPNKSHVVLTEDLLKGSLDHTNNSTEEYFFSNSLDSFVQRNPLKITDPGVKEAANSLGIKLWWDDEGYIGQINFFNTIRLFNKLDLELMSPTDYWKIFKDAFEAKDMDFIRELLSKNYAEWLNVIFFKDNGKYYMIEHPSIIDEGVWDKEKDKRRIKEIIPPEGRHAWFHFPSLDEVFDVIDKDTGFPKKERVDDDRGNDIYTFKYWDIYSSLIDEMDLVAIRGRVTSSDSPSLDCGMPPSVDNAKKIMIRPLRKKLLAPPIEGTILKSLNEFISKYDQAMKNENYSEFYNENKSKILEFINSLDKKLTQKLKSSQENSYIKIREKYADILGFLRVYAITNDPESKEAIGTANNNFFNVLDTKTDFNDFKKFVVSSKKRLQEALNPKNPQRIVFVMGHRNPDTDTVISSLLEAYRNQLLNPHVTYIPVVQNPTLPDEVSLLLLDKEISNAVFLTDKEGDKEIYDEAYNSGQANWILVDHNVSPFQKFVISILDHHTPSETALKQDIAKTIEVIGSTTGMVLQRFHGLGMEVDVKMARIAYGATLMDTENRTPKKTTLKDLFVMDAIQKITGIVDDIKKQSKEFYQELMSALLNTNNPHNLFNRDYKEDWGFGFSVAKMKNVFTEEGSLKKDKQAVLKKMVDLSKINNSSKNFPLTLLKIADYKEDNETVRKERMYFEFSKDVTNNFKNTVMDIFEVILHKEFKGLPLQIERTKNYIEWGGVGLQLSRKKVAPILEPVVDAFNEYFWSDSIQKHVRRDFLKISDKGVMKAAKKLSIELSSDENNNINNLTPIDLMRLVSELKGTVLTPAEYLSVLSEAKTKNDLQLETNLQSHEFTEILNIVVLGYDKNNETGICLINPEVSVSEIGEFQFKGEKVMLKIPFSEPGLINWEKVSTETGLPVKVFQPGEKTSPDIELSRYWSPNPEKACVFARGSIFIYQIPCMDGKVKLNEKQPSIGVRLIREKVFPAYVNYKIQGEHIVIDVDSDSGKRIYVDGVKLPLKEITEEINLELLEVNPHRHSLDVNSYIQNMMPEEVLKAKQEDKLGEIQIHYGPIHFVKEKNPLLLEEYKDVSLIDPDDCKIGWFVKENSEGKLDVIITDIRGKSKLMHQLYGLKFLGVNAYTVFSYEFDFIKYAKEKIFEGMKGRFPHSFNVGKSILGRKILRKSVYAAVFQRLQKDLEQKNITNIKEYLIALIEEAAINDFSSSDLTSFFNDEHVKLTMQRIQSMLYENPDKNDLVTYWQAYGDAVEDFVRIIRTINTGFLDVTKFAKRLEASNGLENVIFTNEAKVYFEDNGQNLEADLSDLLVFKENPKSKNPKVSFKSNISLSILKNHKTLKQNINLQAALINIFKFYRLFKGELSKLPDYENVPEIEYLDEKFYEDNIDPDVFDLTIVRRPKNSQLNETVFEPVGRYPFGSLSADFAEAAVQSGAKYYFHVGSAGAFCEKDDVIKWNLKKGDIIVPYEVYNKQGKLLGKIDTDKMLDNIRAVLNKSTFPYRILKYEDDRNLNFVDGLRPFEKTPENIINIILSKHTSVDTPLEEDETLVEKYKKLGITSVDCESAKVIERVKELGKPLDFEFMFWVADIPGTKGEDLSTEKHEQTIKEATHFRKVKGILADIYTHLKFEEDRKQKIFLPPNIRKVSNLEETPLIDDINKNPEDIFALLLIGPTSAGKSTFLTKCKTRIKGRSFKDFQVDNYFKDNEEKPRDENGVLQFDIPEALHLDWIVEDLTKLLNGEEVYLASYDFENNISVRHDNSKKPLKLEKGDILLIDSIHARHPLILNAVKDIKHASVYLDCPRTIRLLRRIRRDIEERGLSVEFNLTLWPGIEKAEDEFILPHKNVSDYVFSTKGDDELSTLREPLLKILHEALEIVEDKDIRAEIFKLINILDANMLYKRFVEQNDVGMMFLKGGENGGLNPDIKRQVLNKLDNMGFEVVEGPVHKISFKEKLKRWGKGYFYWHFLKKIIDNKNLSNSFVNDLKRVLEDGDEEGFEIWYKEAVKLAENNKSLQNALLLYEYYSDDGQYLFIKPKTGVSFDIHDMSFQKFVKHKIVGETVCYNAKDNQLRSIIAKALKPFGKLRAIMEKALQIENEDEVFLSSKFNAIHCPDFDQIDEEDELRNEFFCMLEGDISKLSNMLNEKDVIIKLENIKINSSFPVIDGKNIAHKTINKAA